MQLLERSINKQDTETIKKHLAKAQIQLEKVNVLIADLLDISKIESGKIKFNMQDFCIDQLIDNLIEVMYQSNPEFKINRRGFANRAIYGDEMRLEQVIVNFLTNAIKYSPGTNEIDVTVNVKDGELYLSLIHI